MRFSKDQWGESREDLRDAQLYLSGLSTRLATNEHRDTLGKLGEFVNVSSAAFKKMVKFYDFPIKLADRKFNPQIYFGELGGDGPYAVYALYRRGGPGNRAGSPSGGFRITINEVFAPKPSDPAEIKKWERFLDAKFLHELIHYIDFQQDYIGERILRFNPAVLNDPGEHVELGLFGALAEPAAAVPYVKRDAKNGDKRDSAGPSGEAAPKEAGQAGARRERSETSERDASESDEEGEGRRIGVKGWDLPVGVRNNNPGNIPVGVGQTPPGVATLAERDADQRRETRFLVFRTPHDGLTAMARALHTANPSYRITPYALLTAWAKHRGVRTPSVLDAYARSVAGAVKGLPDLRVFYPDTPSGWVTKYGASGGRSKYRASLMANADWHKLVYVRVSHRLTTLALMKAIIRHENEGEQPYSEAAIERAYYAGVGGGLEPLKAEGKLELPETWTPKAPKLIRIIVHWSAGGHRASATDKAHYHFIIEKDGRLVRGRYATADNENGLVGAWHTLGTNTGSIGLAVACMADAAQESKNSSGKILKPRHRGSAPMTEIQWLRLAQLTAELCRRYEIPVSKTTVLGHGRVEKNLGRKQRGKWDPMWLPFRDDAVKKGDQRGYLGFDEVDELFRSQVKAYLATPPKDVDQKKGHVTLRGQRIPARTFAATFWMALDPALAAIGATAPYMDLDDGVAHIALAGGRQHLALIAEREGQRWVGVDDVAEAIGAEIACFEGDVVIE